MALHPVAETKASVHGPWWRSLYAQVLAAVILGAAIGHFWPTFGESLKPLGDAFIKLVKMIIAPVIFLTIAHRHRRHARFEARRPRRRQGVRLFPDLLDAGADRRPDRRQRRSSRARACNIDPATLDRRRRSLPTRDRAHDATIVGFLSSHHPEHDRQRLRRRQSSCRCCSSRSCSASRWRLVGDAASRCSTCSGSGSARRSSRWSRS